MFTNETLDLILSFWGIIAAIYAIYLNVRLKRKDRQIETYVESFKNFQVLITENSTNNKWIKEKLEDICEENQNYKSEIQELSKQILTDRQNDKADDLKINTITQQLVDIKKEIAEIRKENSEFRKDITEIKRLNHIRTNEKHENV